LARYKLIVTYDGTAFAGSQRQTGRRTVQLELENALRPLGWAGSGTWWAGRTDAGVHATGQVAAIDLDWSHSTIELGQALNARLPRDIAVTSVELARPDFHPRFDAVSRSYRYHLFSGGQRDPLRERTAWRIWPAPQGDVLDRLAAHFVGRHDFGAFGSASRKGASAVREVRYSRWDRQASGWRFEISGDGFLYRMVRRIVYLQVAVALGRGSEVDLVRALEQGRSSGRLPAGLAPARGLVLVDVQY
jgi:tRNA pseudouridine38-40 synthase